jgi:DNA-directed RNA polymerase specialized sigma24 family protein
VPALCHPVTAESAADLAVTEMYQLHYRQLVRLAVLLTGDLATAEDLVQDAYADMHGAWGGLQPGDVAARFLRQSVVTRSRAVPPDSAFPVAPQYADPDDAGRSDAGGSRRSAAAPGGPPAILAALRKLAPAQREALALRLYLDLPDDQIAAAMQVSEAAVRDHVQEALAVLHGVS